MNRTKLSVVVLLVVNLLAGCHSDIVCTDRIKQVAIKCIYIEPLKTEDPAVGRVLRDVLEKEFIRRHFEVCDANGATVFISGAAFLTQRAVSSQNLLGASGSSCESIESVSLMVKNRAGEILATASYDNNDRFTGSKLAQELGGDLANKLR